LKHKFNYSAYTITLLGMKEPYLAVNNPLNTAPVN